MDIEQWIKDLSSDIYKVRASANTKLRLVGEPALAYLEKAADKPPDLETSRRAQLLIREISLVAAERRKELLSKDLPRYVRPTFAYVTKAETRGGLPIDIVHIKLSDKDQLATGQMKQLFGPDWDKLRLAIYGKQVVVLLGSEVELFETALANLKDGKAGLAGSKLTQGLDQSQPTKATAAFYLSVESPCWDWCRKRKRARLEPQRAHFLRLDGGGRSALQLDMFLPIADIGVLEKGFRR